MTELEILDVLYETFLFAVRISLPFMIVSLVVGMIIAVFQAATQIHEQTLTFLPKFLALLAILAVTGSSMLMMLQDFTRRIIGMISGG